MRFFILPMRREGDYDLGMDENNLVPRIGTFFIILGVAAISFFVISDLTENVSFKYLFWGLLLTGIGVYFRRDAEKPAPSGRFEWWRSLKNKDNKEKKEKKD